jgi:selenocysteine lyase/cysteine desulfurase
MLKTLDREFNLKKNLFYLNHAGISPWPVRTTMAVQRFAEENMKQGSLQYPKWCELETELRKQAQRLLNAPTIDSIALLKNTSEALSVVAYGIDWKKGDNIVSSNQEFPSNRIVWESLSRKGVEFREADIGVSTPEDVLFSLVDRHTRLITISSVQFGTGLRMDLSRIGDYCKNHGILFCVDAIQSLGAVRFDVQEIKADFVMADGHKWMLGPEGLALFYCNPDVMEKLHITQFGWHMVENMGDFDRKEWKIAETARRFECGSPNMLGIHALSASLSLILDIGMEEIEQEVLRRSEYLFERIQSIPEAALITSQNHGRYGGIVTFRPRYKDTILFYQHLTENNVVCAQRSGGIRLSPHFYIPYDQLDSVVELIQQYLT